MQEVCFSKKKKVFEIYADIERLERFTKSQILSLVFIQPHAVDFNLVHSKMVAKTDLFTKTNTKFLH